MFPSLSLCFFLPCLLHSISCYRLLEVSSILASSSRPSAVLALQCNLFLSSSSAFHACLFSCFYLCLLDSPSESLVCSILPSSPALYTSCPASFPCPIHIRFNIFLFLLIYLSLTNFLYSVFLLRIPPLSSIIRLFLVPTRSIYLRFFLSPRILTPSMYLESSFLFFSPHLLLTSRVLTSSRSFSLHPVSIISCSTPCFSFPSSYLLILASSCHLSLLRAFLRLYIRYQNISALCPMPYVVFRAIVSLLFLTLPT